MQLVVDRTRYHPGAPRWGLEPPQPRRADPHRHGVVRRERLGRPAVARDQLAVLLEVDRQLVGGPVVALGGAPREDDDVVAAAVVVEVQRHPRVGRDVAQLGPVRLAVEQDRAVVPQEPHRARLRGAAAVDRYQPADEVSFEAARDTCPEWRRWVECECDLAIVAATLSRACEPYGRTAPSYSAPYQEPARRSTETTVPVCGAWTNLPSPM